MPKLDAFGAKVMEALRLTDNYPDEMKAWLPRFLADNIVFSVSRTQVTLVDGEAWHKVGDPGQPAFANGCANLGGSYAGAGFYRDYLKLVHLRGQVTGGTIGQVIFVLPAGYRPEFLHRVSIDSNGAHGVIEISASGNVICVVGNNAAVQLDNIVFRAFS